ncbi:RICIN domain-containing protein [Streptomyces sp. NBC_00555]|uniref:RICIN domain-containing protein n=1 Tax=Streptomyces sp. NBC_00555 TaxID=2903662 RepID=UPI0022538919|nr:RICIN domain-containing protein [Streptomyces sp. NBC_00555]MCX5016638.1 RICIN domain-containing protein [Streptomyces sp. NBC_00555]
MTRLPSRDRDGSPHPVSRTAILLRRVGVLLAGALAVTVIALPAHAASTQSESAPVTSTGTLGAGAAPGETVTREQVIERAQAWVDAEVPYSSNGLESPFSWWADDATGGRYRQDCSGFVSMAWQLKSSLSTRSLPSVANRIGVADLKPGDVLNSSQHAVIFGGWTDQAKGTFTYYQQSSRSRPTNKAGGSIHSSTLAGHPTSSYTALRYRNITDSPNPAPASSGEKTAEAAPSPTRAESGPVATAPTHDGLTPSAPRTWVNAVSKKCLEIRGDTTDDGDLASQWECNKSATQQWTSSHPGGTGTLTNANSRLCLEVRADAVHNGANANQWECNGSATQNWHQQPAKGGGWNLVNANSGKCLEIAAGNTNNGAIAYQRDCDGSPAQTWL